jgi:UDP-glucose 4-epimerase
MRKSGVKVFVTGAAGFIGSTLVDRLLQDGHEVVGFDNFSTGRPAFLENARASAVFVLIVGDLLDAAALTQACRGCDVVFHLAANDVRYGTANPRKDLDQNTIATYNMLEAMRANGVRRIVFPSTGSVYGEPSVFPTPEDVAFPIQTSFYGASKLAGEGLIAAYCEGFGFQGLIFRFVSILGERYSHGHVLDFYKQLHTDPTTLYVLGNGEQRKSYLYVRDCVEAMLLAVREAHRKIEIFNLGTDEYCTVNDSIGWITGHLGLSPRVRYGGGERGWTGDSPFIFLDCRKTRALGWKPRLSIKDSVIVTLDYLSTNPSMLDARP